METTAKEVIQAGVGSGTSFPLHGSGERSRYAARQHPLWLTVFNVIWLQFRPGATYLNDSDVTEKICVGSV